MVDALTARADAFFRANTPVLIVSDLAAAEFASAVGRRVRTGDITSDEARHGFSAFDMWTARATLREEMVTADVRAAGRSYVGSTSASEPRTRSISRSRNGSVQRLSLSTKEWRQAHGLLEYR